MKNVGISNKLTFKKLCKVGGRKWRKGDRDRSLTSLNMPYLVDLILQF